MQYADQITPEDGHFTARAAVSGRRDTRNDSRLSRIFQNKLIKIYPAFAEL